MKRNKRRWKDVIHAASRFSSRSLVSSSLVHCSEHLMLLAVTVGSPPASCWSSTGRSTYLTSVHKHYRRYNALCEAVTQQATLPKLQCKSFGGPLTTAPSSWSGAPDIWAETSWWPSWERRSCIWSTTQHEWIEDRLQSLSSSSSITYCSLEKSHLLSKASWYVQSKSSKPSSMKLECLCTRVLRSSQCQEDSEMFVCGHFTEKFSSSARNGMSSVPISYQLLKYSTILN